ncbi:MAG TPA: lamin tail domain-containing protein, partial [Candidatus Binatia bacterium]|nr:lamin tail domain-containing protein [Candidatus Binatia bacterium]
MKIFTGGLRGMALGTLLALFLCRAGQAQIVINEVMADNQTVLQNEGIYPDWVELYNSTSTPVDIGDWSLSTTATNSRAFVFPAGTVIASNGYLLVWCDGLGTNAPGLHKRFRLSKAGESVALYNAVSSGG